VLFSDTDNELSKARLKAMAETNDGFKISEEDLKLRGPGDFFGARQHGLPDMRLADLGMDMRVLSEAQEAAQRLLKADPELRAPENARLKARIDQLFEINGSAFN
jgi:ATP-dependent DNA helicase RecG